MRMARTLYLSVLVLAMVCCPAKAATLCSARIQYHLLPRGVTA